MMLFESAWGLVSAIIVFIFGALLVQIFSRKLLLSFKRALAIYLWHTLLCIIYASYVSKSGGDANMYYLAAIPEGLDFKFGTIAVRYLSQAIKNSLQLSFGGVFLVFNIFGTIGLLAFDASLRGVTQSSAPKLRRLASAVVFLPSISFWTSAIGKDSLAFMSVGLALWAALKLTGRTPIMIFAILIMLFVRPYMAAIMVAGLTLAFALSNKINVLPRIMLATLSIVAATIVVPLAIQQSGLGDELDESSFVTYVEKRQSYNMEGGGGVDIKNMPLPLQLFTYLFRPLPFEVHSIFSLAASIDNILLLYIFFIGIPKLIKRPGRGKAELRSFLWVYALSSWLILSMTTANMGISMRQKWMFVPVLIFLLLSAVSRAYADKKQIAMRIPNF